MFNFLDNYIGISRSLEIVSDGRPLIKANMYFWHPQNYLVLKLATFKFFRNWL